MGSKGPVVSIFKNREVIDSRRRDLAAFRLKKSRKLSGRRGAPDRDETGAVLILALAFILAIGLVVGTLAAWASNSLRNTTQFQSASELHYALSSATNTAVESIRYSPLPSNPTLAENNGQATPIGECWTPSSGSASTLTVDGYSVAVWCTTTIDLAQNTTRVVSLFTCLSTVNAAQCAAAPLLAAQVTYDDYPTGGGVTLTEQCNLENGACGFGQTLDYWTWN